MGTVVSYMGDLDLEKQLLKDTLERARKFGNRAMAATAINSIAAVKKSSVGVTAVSYYLGALNIARETGDRRTLIVYLHNVAEEYIESGGDIREDESYLKEALQIGLRLSMDPGVLYSIHLAGWITMVRGDVNAGLALLDLVYDHPTSTIINTRNIKKKLGYMGHEIDDPEVEAGMEQGRAFIYETVAGELLDDLREY